MIRPFCEPINSVAHTFTSQSNARTEELYLNGASEGDLVDIHVFSQRSPSRLSVPGHDVNNSRRNTRLERERWREKGREGGWVSQKHIRMHTRKHLSTYQYSCA